MNPKPETQATEQVLTPLPPKTGRRASAKGEGGFKSSLRHAWNGLLHAAGQRNMKIHLVATVLVALVGSGLRLGLAEKVTLIFCVMLVLFAEILNTALEALVDLHTEDFRDLARITKDVAAAGVLLLSAGTVIVFAALLAHNLDEILASGSRIARQAAVGIPLSAVVALLLRPASRPSSLKDHSLFASGLVLWALLASWSVSAVFSAMSAAVLLFSWRAARSSRRS